MMMMRATRRPGGAGRSRGNFTTRHVKGSGGGGGGKKGCPLAIVVFCGIPAGIGFAAGMLIDRLAGAA